MIYMETNITIKPGSLGAYAELEKVMVPYLEKAGTRLIGSWSTAIGNTNEMTIIVALEDLGHFQKSSISLAQAKEYQEAMRKAEAIIVSMTRKIMVPMPTSPLK